jgi:hypothetical protein
MCKALALLAVLLGTCHLVYAVEPDGNELLNDCRQFDKPESVADNDQAFSLGFCLAYISGVKDAVFPQQVMSKDSRGTLGVCFPKDGLQNSQSVLIVQKWLKDNPSQLHLPAVVLVMAAFRQAFPCK